MRPVRYRSACDGCNASKTKCSGETTGCVRCSSLQLRCHYSESRVGRVPGIRGRNRRREDHEQREGPLQKKRHVQQQETPPEAPETGAPLRVQLGSPTPLSGREDVRDGSPEAERGQTPRDFWADFSPSAAVDGIDTIWSQSLSMSSLPTTPDSNQSRRTRSLLFSEASDLSSFPLQQPGGISNDPIANAEFDSEVLDFLPGPDPATGLGPETAAPPNRGPHLGVDLLRSGRSANSFAAAADDNAPLAPGAVACGDETISGRHTNNTFDRNCPPRAPDRGISTMQPLLHTAHQLELDVARSHHDLYATLNVVKLAMQELQSAVEHLQRRPDLERARAELMVCVVAHQVTELLVESCSLALGNKDKTRRQSTGSSIISSSIRASGDMHSSPTESGLPLGHPFQMDDDDRRAMEVVMVQRQVKRGLAVVRWLRATRAAGIATHEGERGGVLANVNDISALAIEMTEVESRLTRLANILREEADLNP
ncbi:hypothetical protein DL764_004372 [Monosporascus ibericus]|uniref:Zn(2)-C6 fungal-type domain-containing protein n=1 Tax=Monosporascus ibericus TaxID=155417 RepID=A0A4Q4TFM6_9PEZI|nr:hypothetical protein DL764_004372 [Monosporascus ibericus]